MELIIYEAKDWKAFSSKLKSAWQEFKGAIRTVAVKVLARIIQLYIIVTTDDAPQDLKLLTKLLPIGALILFDITLKSFPYASILGCGAYALYKSVKNAMNEENYQEALTRAEKLLNGREK